jgi:hypothetical protein
VSSRGSQTTLAKIQLANVRTYTKRRADNPPAGEPMNTFDTTLTPLKANCEVLPDVAGSAITDRYGVSATFCNAVKRVIIHS